MEMEEGRALVRNEEARLKRRPKIIAAGAAAAVLLTVAWLLRGLVLGPILVAWSDFQIEVEKTRQPDHWVKKPVYPSAAIPLPPSAPAPVAVSSFVYLNAGAPGTTQAAHAAPPPPAPAPAAPREAQPAILPPPAPAFPAKSKDPPSPGEIYIQGLVYDLRTNAPVKNVTVRFEQPRGGSRWEALTNEDGRYWVSIFKDSPEDLVVTIEAPGYRKGLLEDKDPPYRDRSPPARASIMAETVDSDLDPVPLRYRDGEQIIDLDLVLVPEVKK
ncbi:MAG: carboxypeptidase-like regulatory domain-containing protein [Elusimicrobia bacterium]|nr:carboxypeptidase-like regulatory domain-containing protein [Elusimicrobiota bacterium]